MEKKLAAAEAARLDAEKALAETTARAPRRQEPSLPPPIGAGESEEVVEAELVSDEDALGPSLSPPKPPRRDLDRPPPSLGPRRFGKRDAPTDISDIQRADEEAAQGPEPAPFGTEAEESDLLGRRPPKRTPRLRTVADKDESDRS